MKLEKDRLIAKLDNLESNLRQIQENQDQEQMERGEVSRKPDTLSRKSGKPAAETKPAEKTKIVANPTPIPPKDRPNPY